MQEIDIDHAPSLEEQAKALVALAFRNGPIEDVHAGELCPTCHGSDDYSRITQDEMRLIMKTAVDRVYTLLKLQDEDPGRYHQAIGFGLERSAHWDAPELETRW